MEILNWKKIISNPTILRTILTLILDYISDYFDLNSGVEIRSLIIIKVTVLEENLSLKICYETISLRQNRRK